MSDSNTTVSVRVIAGGSVQRITWESDEPLTVQAALGQANIALNPSQGVAVNGEPRDLDSYLDDGDRLVVAGNKSAGR